MSLGCGAIRFGVRLFACDRRQLPRRTMALPTTWRERAVDEFREQPGAARKAWWVLRFILAVATLGNCSFGVAALGSDSAKFDRAARKAAELKRRRESGAKRRNG